MRARASFFFFNDTATTEIYTLSLHDALPISPPPRPLRRVAVVQHQVVAVGIGEERHVADARVQDVAHELDALALELRPRGRRSEEHTSELQSRQYLVCRLLLEKKMNHAALYN